MIESWIDTLSSMIGQNPWLAPLLALCAGVLIVLLGILAGGGNLAWGIVLMLCYSIGHSALVMAAGTSVGFVQKINNSEKYKRLLPF